MNFGGGRAATAAVIVITTITISVVVVVVIIIIIIINLGLIVLLCLLNQLSSRGLKNAAFIITCSYIYYTTIYFGQSVQPATGSLQIHIQEV
jgi:hypothetical protein